VKPRSNAILCVILVAILCFAAPFAGGILLRTSAVQKRIGDALSAATGMLVSYESFKPGLFNATRITRLKAADQEGRSFSATEARVKLAVWPLLRGRLVFREIRLNEPRILVVEPPNPETANAATPPASIAPSAVNPSVQIDQSGTARRFAILNGLRTLRVTDASLEWHLADGRTKLQVEGLNVQLDMEAEAASEVRAGQNSTPTGTGNLSIQRLLWMDAFQATDLRSGVAIADNAVQVKDIQAACGEGIVKGEGRVGILAPQAFSLRVDATGVDLEKMSADLPSLRLEGKAKGNLAVEGVASDDASWRGTATLQVEEGRFKGVSVLQMIGQVFQIQELSNFKIRHGSANLRIADKKVLLDEFQLDGNDVALSAPGSLDFGRNLALSAKLTVSEKLIGGKMLQLLSGFGPPDETGMRSIGFQVGGTLERPTTNLLEKAVGGGLGGVVNQLLGGFLKGRKIEKPAQKEASPGEGK
jgi:hypothetical protein